jgi:hypothetical protein
MPRTGFKCGTNSCFRLRNTLHTVRRSDSTRYFWQFSNAICAPAGKLVPETQHNDGFTHAMFFRWSTVTGVGVWVCIYTADDVSLKSPSPRALPNHWMCEFPNAHVFIIPTTIIEHTYRLATEFVKYITTMNNYCSSPRPYFYKVLFLCGPHSKSSIFNEIDKLIEKRSVRY